MKKITFLLVLFIPAMLFAQSSRDINTVIQKTIDLHALKQYYNDDEKAGTTPLIIINDTKIPDNLIVFKFNKRVKIMTSAELETFKKISKKNLDSYFVFEKLKFTETEVVIKVTFRGQDKIAVNANMKKENNRWMVTNSHAG